jgi:type I restriction enzyme M protein
VKDTEFEIYHGDTLTNAWDFLRETNPAKKPQFDAVVANPPFSYRWEPTDAISEDMRFKSHGVAPKSAADLAFLLHGLHYLKDDGVMAIILPHGVLFRGGVEERIRRKLLDDGHIDTVIGHNATLSAPGRTPSRPRVSWRRRLIDSNLHMRAAAVTI